MRGIILSMTAVVVCVMLSSCYSPPSSNALVGKTDAQVNAILGRPQTQSPGHYGNPSLTWAHGFKGDIETLVYKEHGGHVYVSFEKRNGSWIAICNDWLANGAEF